METTTLPVSTHSEGVEQKLANKISTYINDNPKSKEAHQNASSSIPSGTTRSVLSYQPFPLFLSGGRECFVTSLDGHEYLDFVSEYGAGMFGHSNPDIKAAIQTVVESGFTLGGPGLKEAELAQLLVERFASVDAIRFCNSGTEANTLAIATALAYTGRKKILVFENGYHGGTLSFARHNPMILPHQFVYGQFNNIENTKAIIELDVGVILVEPLQFAGGQIMGQQPFLQFLRDEATRLGAVLIFDEVVTSRLQFGGLQEHFGIVPDMTTLGKHFGGGFSFGAFGGSKKIMDLYNPKSPRFLIHSGTWNNNLFSMTAGVAATKLLTREALEKLSTLGNTLREGITEVFAAADSSLACFGFGSIVGVGFNGPDDGKWRDLFYFYLLQNRIYIGHRGFLLLNLTHSREDADRVIAVVKKFCEEYFPPT